MPDWLAGRARKIGQLAKYGSGGGLTSSDLIREWVSRARGHHRATAQVAVSSLRGHLSARTQGLDHPHVDLLAQHPDPLPPIVVHKDSMRVVDGLHRLRVAELRGQNEIDVALFEGSEDEAFALSALLNVRQGLPLPLVDRRRAAARILLTSPGWSDRFIASVVGLSHKTIASIRHSSTGDSRQLNERIGRDGKTRPIDIAGGRLRAADLLAENPEMSLRQLARLAEISVATARDVRLRLRDGYDPVPNNRQRSTTASTATADSCAETWVVDKHLPIRDRVVPPPTDVVKQGGGSSRRNRQTTSAGLLLERLKKDPAVRFNEAGRNLIRQLGAAQLAVTTCQQVMPFAPAHCLNAVAEIAQAHAESWQQLASLAQSAAQMEQAL